MKLPIRIALSALGSGLVYGIFYLFIGAGIIMSLLFAAAAFMGMLLFLSPARRSAEMKELEEVYGISAEMLKKVLKEGRKKVAAMKKAAGKIEDPAIREKVTAICNVAENIFRNFEHDPKDVKAARQFLNYYLDATMRIIKQYSILSRTGVTAEKNESLKKVEAMMDKIESAFEKQLTMLHDDDYLDLDTEISVLEKSLKSDGLH